MPVFRGCSTHVRDVFVSLRKFFTASVTHFQLHFSAFAALSFAFSNRSFLMECSFLPSFSLRSLYNAIWSLPYAFMIAATILLFDGQCPRCF